METTEAPQDIFPDNVFTFLDKCSVSVLDGTMRAAMSQFPDSDGIIHAGGFREMSQHGEILFSNMHLHRIYEAVLRMIHDALFKDRGNGRYAYKCIKFIDEYLNIKDQNMARRYTITHITVELIKIAITKKQTTCLTKVKQD